MLLIVASNYIAVASADEDTGSVVAGPRQYLVAKDAQNCTIILEDDSTKGAA
jgi:hypothetical protein